MPIQNSKPKTHSSFCVILLVIAGIAAYANSFTGQFVLDDDKAILRNPHIRHLWPLAEAMSPPTQSTLAGRPIASLSIALNYAVSGYDVWSYHLVNLLIHLLAGLTLYGIIRRTLLTDRLNSRFGRHAAYLACIIAALWIVHPIQTESVTYIVQRTESLMGLLYLLTLYSAIWAIQSGKSLMWPAVSAICCGLGMATKETMVTAPLLVLLYDRAFFAGTFKSALRCRYALYITLAATWVILAAIIWSGPRSSSAGFAFGTGALEYAANQPAIILHYLRLSLWPDALCLDYCWPITKDWSKIAPPATAILILIAATIWGLLRNHTWAYPAVWFFTILAPSSSFIPIADLAFEHRMYLPLAGFITLLITSGYVLLERFIHRFKYRYAISLVIIIVAAFILRTLWRNKDYHTVTSIWCSVIKTAPYNSRAYYNLGSELAGQGKPDEAIGYYLSALQIKPDFTEAHYNLANALSSQGKYSEAISHYRYALQLKPDFADAHNNLAMLLHLQGSDNEAVSHYMSALQTKPDSPEIHNNLGTALLSQGKLDDAINHFHRALQFRPDFAEADYNLANTLNVQGKLDDAAYYYQQALQAKSDLAEAYYGLGSIREKQGRFNEAISYYRQAMSIRPDSLSPMNALARILADHPDPNVRNPDEAVKIAEHAAQLTQHRNPYILSTLAACYAAAGQFDKAVKTSQTALELASAEKNEKLIPKITQQIELYKQGKLQPLTETKKEF